MFEPGYRKLHASGDLHLRAQQALDLLTPCRVCPRNCGVDRNRGELGFCRIGRNAVVSSYGPHFGEESPLVGQGGSGTIFFSSCSLGCIFCQNYSISHLREGREVTPTELARMMVNLQSRGCHNINVVTPSHVVPQILEALPMAVDRGLSVPLVYNTGGYDALATLKLLDGVFDIFMPDIKFMDEAVSERLTGAADYPDVVKEAVKEMHRQVGDLVLDTQGIAQHGLLVRHLVMPEGLAGTQQVMRFLSREVSPGTYVNIMDQYHPCGEATEPPLNRGITVSEYRQALTMAESEGISRLDDRAPFRWHLL
jgi:putative pyruvate formate lyase activating enzyme